MNKDIHCHIIQCSMYIQYCTNTILMYIVHSTSALHLAGYTVNIIGCICIRAIFYLDLYMHFAHEMYVTIIILIFH